MRRLETGIKANAPVVCTENLNPDVMAKTAEDRV
jgi:hypothetical protein